MPNFRPGYLQQGAPLGATRKQVMLVADNTQIDVSGYSYLELSSDNTTASNRTFTMVQSALVGQMLEIVFVSGGSTTAQLVNSGTVKLAEDWTPVQYSSLTLFWDGSYWIEMCRTPLISAADIPLADGEVLVGNSSNVAAGVAMSGDISIDNTGATAIGAGKVLLAMLGSGIAPSHVVKFAGKHTTTGGSATEAFTVTGVADTDIVFAQLQTAGLTPRAILTAAPTLNTVTLVFDGDPSTDHVVAYQVLRAAT